MVGDKFWVKPYVKNDVDPMPRVKGTQRGSYGPGFTEYGHHASSRRRLAALQVQNCKRSFDMNVGEQRLIKAR